MCTRGRSRSRRRRDACTFDMQHERAAPMDMDTPRAVPPHAHVHAHFAAIAELLHDHILGYPKYRVPPATLRLLYAAAVDITARTLGGSDDDGAGGGCAAALKVLANRELFTQGVHTFYYALRPPRASSTARAETAWRAAAIEYHARAAGVAFLVFMHASPACIKAARLRVPNGVPAPLDLRTLKRYK